MASLRDKAGRPVVAVTGMGIVTSLGAGQGGQLDQARRRPIRHPHGHALLDRRPEDPDRRHRRLRAGRAVQRAGADRAARRTRGRRSDRAGGIGGRGDFPGPLFLAVPPVEIEWPQRTDLAAASGANDEVHYDDLLRAAATGRFQRYYDRFMFGSVGERISPTASARKGSPISLTTACASGATAIQLGVEAIRRGETDAALCIGTDGSVNPESADPLLAALGALDRQRSAGSGVQAVLEEPRRLRHGRRRRRAGAGKLRAARARGATILGVVEGCGETRRLVPPHPLEPGRQADHRLHAQRARRCRPRRPTTSTTSTRTAPRRRRTTRWNASA